MPDPTVLAELVAIRDLVRGNVPRSGDPERYHETKSEITARLTRVIDAYEAGKPVPPWQDNAG